MYVSKKLRDFIDERKKHHSYWAQRLKLDFALQLDRRLRQTNISYADLADRIDSSRAYVSKVFKGESNLTIESMVKLAHSTGARIDLRLIDEGAACDPKIWFGKLHTHAGGGKSISVPAASTSTNADQEQTYKIAA